MTLIYIPSQEDTVKFLSTIKFWMEGCYETLKNMPYVYETRVNVGYFSCQMGRENETIFISIGKQLPDNGGQEYCHTHYFVNDCEKAVMQRVVDTIKTHEALLLKRKDDGGFISHNG